MEIMKDWELLIFLLFFIPGFISIRIYQFLVPSEPKDFSKALFEAIGYSSINYAVFSWLIIIINTGSFRVEHSFWYYLIIFFIIFVAPILWAVMFFKLPKWRLFRKYLLEPYAKPWDAVFSDRKSYWVIVHLNDGKKVAGIYGSSSYASAYPQDEQLFIEEVWLLDAKGKFVRPVNKTSGIIVLGNDISMVEFFK